MTQEAVTSIVYYMVGVKPSNYIAMVTLNDCFLHILRLASNPNCHRNKSKARFSGLIVHAKIVPFMSTSLWTLNVIHYVLKLLQKWVNHNSGHLSVRAVK